MIGGLCGLLFGYGTGAVATGLPYINTHFGLDAVRSGLVVSCLLMAAAFASPVAGLVADSLGRDVALCISAAIYGVGVCMWASSSSFWMLIAGRVLVGAGIGSLSFLGPMAIAERVPSSVRGITVSFDQLMVTIGILAATIAGHVLGNGREWRVVAALPIVGVLCLITLVLPQLDNSYRRVVGRKPGGVGGAIRLLVGVRSVRRNFFLALILAAGVHLTGLNVAVYYAPTVIAQVGARPEVATAGSAVVALVNVLCTFVAMALIDRLGRRPLMIGGLLAMALCALGFGIVSGETYSVSATIVLLALFLAAGAIGPAAVFWVYVSELFPSEIRATAFAWATFVQWMTDFLVSQIFPGLISVYSFGGAMRYFSLLTYGTLIVTCVWMQETRGRELPELES